MSWHRVELSTDQPNASRYQIEAAHGPMTWNDVLDAWEDSPDFADWYTNLLAGEPHDAFWWETPRLRTEDLHLPFEWVVIAAPHLARSPTPEVFDAYLQTERLVTTFVNLGGDADLVVPRPVADDDDFAHLAAFVRSATTQQTRDLWAVTGRTVRARIGATPLWLSTAGDGVAWLHIRLDQRPKYYSYRPYR